MHTYGGKCRLDTAAADTERTIRPYRASCAFPTQRAARTHILHTHLKVDVWPIIVHHTAIAATLWREAARSIGMARAATDIGIARAGREVPAATAVAAAQKQLGQEGRY
jgi:hypothetical protein|eukprot:COSAG01_NODE_12342_length_1756_cov_2.188896_2_plen_109_part_00